MVALGKHLRRPDTVALPPRAQRGVRHIELFVESRVRWKSHARFGGAGQGNDRPRGRYRALVRHQLPTEDVGQRA